MKKSWLGYGLLAALVTLFVWVWMETGEFVGAVLSISVVALIGGLILAVLAFLFSIASALLRRNHGVSWEDHLSKLEASGEALREEYVATRALTVEELSTGSVLHFLDLGRGKVLCLFGQQYYEFEPINDDPDMNQARKFPTETFSLLRDEKTGEVLSLFPGSKVLEPTVCDPVVWPQKLWDLGFELKDGEVVSGSNMDAIEQVIRAAKH